MKRDFEQISKQVDEWLQELDLRTLSRQAFQFGREKPMAMAVAAFTVGMAAGILLHRLAGGEESSSSGMTGGGLSAIPGGKGLASGSESASPEGEG